MPMQKIIEIDGKSIGRYITVYEAMMGWNAVDMQYNEDGFYEPWQTGFGPYRTRKQAVDEAKFWAEDEGVPYIENGY